MPATTFYSNSLTAMAYVAAQRADTSAGLAPDQLTDDALVAIVVAASAAECFLNDLVRYISVLGPLNPQPSEGDFSRLVTIANAIDAMEDDHCSIRVKYLAAGVLLNSTAICKGKEPFQSFDDLSVLRNAIVHARPISTDDEGRPARIAAVLAQKGIARPRAPAVQGLDVDSWWMQIRTAEVAWWAANCASALMIQLGESVAAVADTRNLFRNFASNVRDISLRSAQHRKRG